MDWEVIELETPLQDESVSALRAGQKVLLSGIVYTARDAAHRRMHESMQRGEPLPIDLRGQVLYYVGPTPAFGEHIIGSAGPTTALRMDRYTPDLYALGVKATIGKGNRTQPVIDAIQQHRAVYFAALGGIGALLSKKIKSVAVVAYEDLGAEAIHRLEFDRFPLIVINDAEGNDYYRMVRERT